METQDLRGDENQEHMAEKMPELGIESSSQNFSQALLNDGNTF